MTPDRKPSLKGAGGLRKRARGLSAGELCSYGTPETGGSLPLVVRPVLEGVDLAAWLRQNRSAIAERLLQNGGLLFRGFEIGSAERFQQCIESFSSELLDYTYRSTPRTRVSDKIFTSTEYPADQEIPQHNEMAYARSWPLRLWLHCRIPARQGGQTPLADSRRVTARISPATRRRFSERGVTYVRNYGPGLDLPWPEVFQTEDRNQVEEQCREAGLQFEWHAGDRLTTRQVCQGMTRHPQTGEEVWFNQAHLFHVSSLDPGVRDLLLSRFSESGLPRNALYGDGSPIEPEVLDEIRTAFSEETVAFDWEREDVLLLDNVLASHGRTKYQGPRSILVGMTDLCREGSLA